MCLQRRERCGTWAVFRGAASVSPGILTRSKIRYMTQVAQVSAFQHFFKLKILKLSIFLGLNLTEDQESGLMAGKCSRGGRSLSCGKDVRLLA